MKNILPTLTFVVLLQFHLISTKTISEEKPILAITLVNSTSETIDNKRSFSYELNDGQRREETVSVLNAGTEDEAISVEGFYEYTFNGRKYHVKYVADKYGYQPEVNETDVSVVSFIPIGLAKSLLG